MKHILFIIIMLAPSMCNGEKDYDCESRFEEFIASFAGKGSYMSMYGVGANDVIFSPKTNDAQEILNFIKTSDSGKALNLSSCLQWVKNCISEIEELTPGMTSAQIQDTLILNGGLQSYSSGIYSHKKCEFIKVRVKFRETSKRSFPRDPDDVVSEISCPYLGFGING